MTIRLLHTLELLMQEVARSASIPEMVEATGLSSTGTVLAMLQALEEEGYVVPPPKKNMSRSRTLSEKAIKYLVMCGYWDQKKGQVYRDFQRWFGPRQ